jgi:hypothetical protein
VWLPVLQQQAALPALLAAESQLHLLLVLVLLPLLWEHCLQLLLLLLQAEMRQRHPWLLHLLQQLVACLQS